MHPSIYCCRICDLSYIICRPAPPILEQPCGRSNPSPLLMPLAQIIPRTKRRFNWGSVSSKPTYARWATSSPRRAHTIISIHDSSLGVQHATVRETDTTKTNPHVMDCSRRPLQCDGHTLEAHIGGFPPIVSTDVRSACADLPQQGRPLLLGERSGCIQNDVRPIQGSLACGNQPVPQLLEALLVRSNFATIPIVCAIVQSSVVDVEGEVTTTTGRIPPRPYKSLDCNNLLVLQNN